MEQSLRYSFHEVAARGKDAELQPRRVFPQTYSLDEVVAVEMPIRRTWKAAP